MSHPSVQAYLRDAQYTSVGEAKTMLERSFQLRARLTENNKTARISLKQSALTHYEEQPYQGHYHTYGDMFDTAPPQYQGGESGSSGITPPRIPLDQRLVQQPLAKGKRPLEGGGRGQVLKNQRIDHENGPRIKGKSKDLPQCFQRYREPYIPINWRANAHTQYDLQKKLPLPQKGVPIPLAELENLLGTTPTEDDIARSPFIIKAIRNTDINAQHFIYEMWHSTNTHDNTHVTTYVDYKGVKLKPEDVNMAHCYQLLSKKDRERYGDYWAILRRRPGANFNTPPEYMPNKVYKFVEVSRNFQRAGLPLSYSRFWTEAPLNAHKVTSIYPYHPYKLTHSSEAEL
jgi:hypothetical protein